MVWSVGFKLIEWNPKRALIMESLPDLTEAWQDPHIIFRSPGRIFENLSTTGGSWRVKSTAFQTSQNSPFLSMSEDRIPSLLDKKYFSAISICVEQVISDHFDPNINFF